MPPRGYQKPQADSRSIRIDVYVTKAELDAIDGAAEACDLTRAAYVRSCCLRTRPQAKPARITADAIRQLTSIGNNLNQLTRQANSGFVVSGAAIQTTLNEVLSAVRRLS